MSETAVDKPLAAIRRDPSLNNRIITAVVMIPVIIALVFVGGWPLFAVGLVIASIAIHEFCDIVRRAGFSPVEPAALALACAFLLDAQLVSETGAAAHVTELAGLAVAAATVLLFVYLVLHQRPCETALTTWAFSVMPAIYIGWLLRYYLLLRNEGMLASPWAPSFGIAGWELPQGALLLLLVMFCTWACDTGAYFSGRAFGRHKMIPEVSPGKTWEGTLGGVAAASLLGALAGSSLGIPTPLAVGLGFAIGLAAVFGDLAESLIKRSGHVKDASVLIPGHGGMLDRLDSMLFTGVTAYYYLIALRHLGLLL